MILMGKATHLLEGVEQFQGQAIIVNNSTCYFPRPPTKIYHVKLITQFY